MSETLDACSSKEESHGSPAVKKRRVKKYQTDFLMFCFTYQFMKREEYPLCVVCREVFANCRLNARNLHRHLKQDMHLLHISY
jgi:hypothetical protein